MGRSNEAFVEWNQAVSEAERFGDRELLSVSRIFLARGKLVSGMEQGQTILNEVTRESVNIRTNRMYIAFAWQVRGLALRAIGSFNEAENAFRRSLDIHMKEKNFENASFDWFSIASIRSISGNTQGALAALETAIVLDRRVENAWGLAASYRAMGDVHRRAGNETEAIIAYTRARAIYAAMLDKDNEVAEIDRRITNQN